MSPSNSLPGLCPPPAAPASAGVPEGVVIPAPATRAVKRIRALPVKAAYTVGELARAVGVGKNRMRRLLASQRVRAYRSGRVTLVPLVEIKVKLEVLWESILEAERVRRGASTPRRPP